MNNQEPDDRSEPHNLSGTAYAKTWRNLAMIWRKQILSSSMQD
jgi:hypothetical protein